MIARVVAITLIGLAAPAFAQSHRYPPDALDPDVEADQHSKVWDDALDPGRSPYKQLVREAKQLADEHTADGDAEATGKLERAIALLPKLPDAYIVRGELELRLQKWDKCADDLAAAEENAPPDEGLAPERQTRRLELGICESRVGHYGEAERALVSAASGPQVRADAWMRLGEVRIAMGKLDEAIGALDTALELCSSGGCDPTLGLVHFLLASAHDRMRRPGEVEQDIHQGAIADRTFASLIAPRYPLLGIAEADYLLGLAHMYDASPRPEHALVHFRRFVKLATDSPWRRRADEHVRELSGLEFPQTIEKRGGTAPLDLDAARASTIKALPAMRACLAKLPTSVFEVTVTRDGPRTPDSVRDQPRVRTPPAGVGVRDVLELDNIPHADIDTAMRCVQPLAEKMALPTPKDRDSYYILAFQVTGS